MTASAPADDGAAQQRRARRLGADKSGAVVGRGAGNLRRGRLQVGQVGQDFPDRYVGDARAAVDDEAYKAAFREGRATRFEQAVALARETQQGGVRFVPSKHDSTFEI